MKRPYRFTRRRWLKVAGYAAAWPLFGTGCASSRTVSPVPAPASPEASTASPTTTQRPTSVEQRTATAGPAVQPPAATSEAAPQTNQGEHSPSTLSDPRTPNTATATPGHVATPESESLERRIGQMLLVGFRGLDVGPDHPLARDIQKHAVGGVVLFDFDVPTNHPVRNIQSPQQVKRLVGSLQSLAAAPLVIAIDQEGGRVARLKPKHGFPATLSAQVLGATGDVAGTRRQASAIAETLLSVGINLNLAPVVDLNSNPANPVIGQLERSFGADPEVVTQHALAFIKAHHAHGVRCALKHFPGHGSSTGDTHLGVVDVTATWSPSELEPFRAIIQAGLADMIMTAHVFNTHLDNNSPATLSQPTITSLLREQLGYVGVVTCDDIQMGAIRDQFGFEVALQRVIEAGVDMITIANNTVWEEGVTERAVAIIRRLVQQGALSEQRINESYRRIQQFKHQLGQ